MKTLIVTGGKFNKEFAVSFLEKNKYDYVIFEVCPENMTSGNINLFEVPKNE